MSDAKGTASAADEKKCPECGHALKRETRQRPATGFLFVAPYEWKCTNPACDHREEPG